MPFFKAKENGDFDKFAKGKGISFFAFLLSIFIYISIFYIFNLSLSTLFKTNKFWFCISNTLILIIAADYGVFSPSKQIKLDFHDHLHENYSFLKQPQMKTIDVSSLSSLNNHPKIKIISNDIPIQEKEIVVDIQERDNPKDKLQIIIEGNEDYIKDNEAIKLPARAFRRSKSEKSKRSSVDDERKIMVRRSETIKYEANKEENEFSRMTDEELNRRVEEFIQRFNRQIRLQAAATKKN